MTKFVVISGCSGGGKSALLGELGRRGYAVIEEPGRRIISEERTRGGSALPWVDPVGFAERAVEMSLTDLRRAMGMQGPVFFDRGLVDALTALEHASGIPSLHRAKNHPYHSRVFLAPPWPEIFVRDADRRHGLDEAEAEYERLRGAFVSLGYATEILPRDGVGERVDLILNRLQRDRPQQRDAGR